MSGPVTISGESLDNACLDFFDSLLMAAKYKEPFDRDAEVILQTLFVLGLVEYEDWLFWIEGVGA